MLANKYWGILFCSLGRLAGSEDALGGLGEGFLLSTKVGGKSEKNAEKIARLAHQTIWHLSTQGFFV